MRKPIPFTWIVIAMLLSSSAWAATVTNTADSGPGSLRTVIASSPAGERITFDVGGPIVLTTAELLINKNLTILATNLTIQRSAAAGIPDFRILNITSGSVTISGLTISNGRATTGGGINNQGNLV